MSRKGNPWNNAACESLMKTLKYEEVHRNEYRDLEEARNEIGTFLDKIYNRTRLHSAIGYLPPVKFEANLAAQKKEAAARQLRMSFFRHREIFRSDVIRSVRERRQRSSRPHRLDEFPVGYSLADCSPAGSTSASPAAYHFAPLFVSASGITPRCYRARRHSRDLEETGKPCSSAIGFDAPGRSWLSGPKFERGRARAGGATSQPDMG